MSFSGGNVSARTPETLEAGTHPAVAIREVTIEFGSQGLARRRVLDGLTLEVPTGQFVAVVGASGCGKTTILNMISGLLEADFGRVEVFGAPTRVGRTDVGYMFARDGLLPWRTARRNVELGLEMRGLGRRARRATASQLLNLVYLPSASEKYPGELSQGMRQRVALARTWATNPDLLLMDEPFAALDAQTRGSVRDRFLEIWDGDVNRKTVVFVTHDLIEALVLADRIVVIARGGVASDVRVPFARPRDQREILARPDSREIYDALVAELEAPASEP